MPDPTVSSDTEIITKVQIAAEILKTFKVYTYSDLFCSSCVLHLDHGDSIAKYRLLYYQQFFGSILLMWFIIDINELLSYQACPFNNCLAKDWTLL